MKSTYISLLTLLIISFPFEKVKKSALMYAVDYLLLYTFTNYYIMIIRF